MIAVASQPITRNRLPMTKWPMICGCAPSSIMTTMIGTAITPLITALQNSALIGLIGEKLMAKVEETARKSGYKVLGCFAHLDTSDYFAKFGFKVTELPTLLISTHQVVWMEKEL